MDVSANERLAEFFANLEDRPLSKPELVSCLHAIASNTAGLKIRPRRPSSAASLHFMPAGISQSLPRLQRSLQAPSLPSWDQHGKPQGHGGDSSRSITKTARAILSALDIEEDTASDNGITFSFDIEAIRPAAASCCTLSEEDVSGYAFD